MGPESRERKNTWSFLAFMQELHFASEVRYLRRGVSGRLSHFSGVQPWLLLYEVFWAGFQMPRASCLACLSSHGPRPTALWFVFALQLFFL